MDLAAALRYLDDHINYEAVPADAAALRLERVRRLLHVMGDPHRAYPVVHVAGTNGKGSTAWMASSLLTARGLSVGVFTKPHLERLNERLAWGDEPISDAALAEVIEGVALAETMVEDRPTWFEIVTAAAFRWFADIAVDVAVVEVGLGGRNDATNVVDGEVAVVTNISLDHAEYLGPTLEGIAREKAGIIKPESTLVLGETDPALVPIFREEEAAETWMRGEDFACEANQVAHGGRLLDLRTPGGRYDDVYLPLHGAHQGENAALALAAVEAFFGDPLDPEVVAEGLGAVRAPGRLEVMGRRPLCLLDAAHNPAGARALAAALDEDFRTVARRVLVVGFLRGREPAEMLDALEVGRFGHVVACTPPSPRALHAEQVVPAARAAGVTAEAIDDVGAAVQRGLELAGPDDLVLVAGSLYVVGAARASLSRRAASAS